jgi:hypothetical protein
MEERAALDAASELLQLMIARSTDGGEVSKSDFRAARSAVLADPVGGRFAPECVRVSREPDAVWSYVKSQDPPLTTYESRRIFLRGQFAALLDALERIDSSPIDEIVGEQVGQLSAGSVERAWAKALERRHSDPEGAITSARSTLESVCKVILDDRSVEYDDRDDLPKLYRKTAAALKIAPSEHTEEQFRAILGACTTVVNELGSLRNRVSDSHGPGRTTYRPSARHAALAVNLAGSMALFLMETHEVRGGSPTAA